MAKRATGVRLMRSLARAGKAQQSLIARLFAAAAPKPVKAAKAAKAVKPAKVAKAAKAAAKPLTIRKHTRPEVAVAPGKWLSAQFPRPLQPGQAAAHHLSYWLYLPERAPETVSQRGWPLVVMLHGCHQSATQFAQGSRMNLLAEGKGYAVLYPQQSISAQSQRCWRWYDRSHQQGGGETAMLAALIGNICEQHAIDRRRIYACGISAGAGMAAVLALNHPELVAAVGLHSGPVFGAAHSPATALQVMRHGAAAHADAAIGSLLQRRSSEALPGMAAQLPPMPALMIQGDADHVVRPVNQDHLAAQWLRLNGLPADAAAKVLVKPAGRGGSRNAYEVRDYVVGRKVLLRVARIAGLGHEWSGGDPAQNFNAKAGPDASRMMLEFFGKHRR
jgi:poly(hydroxyalkanoate) depolymerase family esterase